MAVYQVKNKATGKIRLVETRTKVSAQNHVSADDYEITTLKLPAILALVKQGTEVETLTAEEEADDKAVADKPATTATAQTAAAPKATVPGKPANAAGAVAGKAASHK